MNTKSTALIFLSALGGLLGALCLEQPLTERDKFGLSLREHLFNNRLASEEKDDGEEAETDHPERAWEQDYMRIMNPAIGRPTPEVLPATINAIRSGTAGSNIEMGVPGSTTSPWVERGPSAVGGRTRSLVWDPTTANKVWAGGSTGGLWYNNDITNASSPWVAVGDFWANISVTCMAFDPNNAQIAYVGTGEGFTAGGSSTTRGAGIWKTVNGGTSWTQLTSTSGYYYVNDIVVRIEAGNSVVYAAIDERYYGSVWHGTTYGLVRSTTAGISWTQVLPVVPSQTSNYAASDIEISANNRIWVGTKSNPYGKGGGAVLYSDNGTTWTTSTTVTVADQRGRVELACAPSNASVVYAAFEDNGQLSQMMSTANAGALWTAMAVPEDADNGIPASDFTRGQAWYDLVLAVDPANANNVIAGGIDLFRSVDGGGTWDQVSKWSNNNNLAALPCSEVHGDHHAVIYKPGSSSTLVVGNDGGVYYTSSIASATTSAVFSARNTNYNTTQFYSCAMHPGTGSNIYLGGAQDNGTQRFTQPGFGSTTKVDGGDGGYCFIDQTNPQYQISSYIYNSYSRSTNGGTSDFTEDLINDPGTGKFINPADYDDNQHILYSCKDASSIYRVKNITGTPSSPVSVTITGLNDPASHIRVSPYTTGSTTLFIGTDAGKLFKVTNADNTPAVTNITGSAFPAGSISCIEIGASENELLVTFFNYGVTSVWYTSNGGASWVSKEGTLPDMPVRWALFNPDNRNEVLLATELGIWATLNLSATSPAWTTSNNGMANVRVDMLQMRASDKLVIAATHGRGVFTSNGFSASSPPVPLFSTSNTAPCLNQTVIFTDTSTLTTSRIWVITPSTYTFVNGTNANSTTPNVLFAAAGAYNISLTVTNANGSATLMKSNHVWAGGLPLPFSENWENIGTYQSWTVDNPDNDIGWSIFATLGNAPGTFSVGVGNFDYQAAQSTFQRDGLISPPINLANYSSATLTFKHAYGRYDSQFQDSMAVYVSTNCGTSWIRVASYKETQSSTPYVWVTLPNQPAKFTPSSAADWCGSTGYATCKSINLTPFAGLSIKVKFENLSGFGNNVYIDDINVSGVSSLPAPVAGFTASATTTCTGNSISFTDQTTNTPYLWNWVFTPSTVTFLNGTGPTSQNPVVTFNSAASYTVALTATNTNTSNTVTKTNHITVNQSLTPSIVVTSPDSVTCAGKTAVFTAAITGGGTAPVYQWKLNGSNVGTNSPTYSTSSLVNSDTVQCTLTSNAPCASISFMASNKIIVKVNPVPTVSLNLNVHSVCNKDTIIVLSGGAPSGGFFSGTSVAGNTFKPALAGAGTFTLTYAYTSPAGCSSSTTDQITVLATPAVPAITRSGNTLTCTSTGVTYKWYLNNAVINGATSQTYDMLQSGTYKVEVTNPSSCSAISADFPALKTGITDISFLHGMKVYPNPSKDIFRIEFKLDKASPLHVTVYDAVGRRVVDEHASFKEGLNSHIVKLGGMAAGHYLLRIHDGAATAQQSLILE